MLDDEFAEAAGADDEQVPVAGGEFGAATSPVGLLNAFEAQARRIAFRVLNFRSWRQFVVSARL